MDNCIYRLNFGSGDLTDRADREDWSIILQNKIYLKPITINALVKNIYQEIINKTHTDHSMSFYMKEIAYKLVKNHGFKYVDIEDVEIK
jgi:hypothetical protein